MAASISATSASAHAYTSFEMPASAFEISHAKADFWAFLKSEHAKPLMGNIIDFGKALKIIGADVNLKGAIFTAIFEQAREKGHLINLAKVFFDGEIDQGAFIDDLVQETIVYAEKVKTDDGIYVEPSKADIEESLAEVVGFIHSDDFRLLTTYPLEDFKKKLALIDRRSKGNEGAAYFIDYPTSPGHSKLFSDLIQDAAENSSITEKTRDLFFSHGFNQVKFIQSIRDAL
jgi:hypothetical protein